MSSIKHYKRYNYLIELIKKKRTGSPDELAKKLNLSKRSCYRMINELREEEGYNIKFCYLSNSYFFE